MTSYLFYPTADAEQDAIWRYSVAMWSEKQAEIYIRGLHEHIKALASLKKPWRTLPKHLVNPIDIDHQVYFSRYKHHIIFFRQLSSATIGIMSILHEAMDIPSRLQEDLRILDRP